MTGSDISPRKLPEGWRWARLGEVCSINPPTPSLRNLDESQPTTFVPMAALDERYGAIMHPGERPLREVIRGYTYFEEGDVLFAKITPCMQNGKHAVARGLRAGFGFGSTELHVIRPHLGILSEWVHAFVRQPALLREAAWHFAGVRVSRGCLRVT